LTTSANPDTPSTPAFHEHQSDAVVPTAHPDTLRHPHNVHADHDATPDVEIVDVTKRFGDVVAVDAMRLAVERGSFYSFLGPSGCGKTTTLRMIAGFEQPTEGEIYLAGEPVAGVPPYRRNVNTVFQHYALFPHMDVAKNVGYGLRQRNISKEDEKRKVGEALELVRLNGYDRRRTWELSGGQQQRVALARALVNHPSVLLLDEPLGALDRALRHDMQFELKQLQREVGITFVYVTHDQEEALTMSDVIVVMQHGRIQQQGRPTELYERPANRFVAAFIGSSNFIPAALVERDGDQAVLAETPSGLRIRGQLTDPGAEPVAGADVTLAIRPERIHVEAAPDGAAIEQRAGWTTVPGRLTQGTFLGESTEFRVATDAAGELVVRLQNNAGDQQGAGLGPGQPVLVRWPDEATLVLAG
jgi:spermidine/putrescine transport system ATP-binding protein